MKVRSRVLPSGGSAILNAWRQTHGPEALRTAALVGDWRPGAAPGARLIDAGGLRQMRAYMGASNDRLVADLADLMDISANADVRSSLKALRKRSRQLAKDNEWVKRFLQLVRDNVVGPRGFTFQSKIYKARRKAGQLELDGDANSTIEEAYARQSKLGNFSACGLYTRATFERACVNALACDGEVIIEKLIGRMFGPFGIAWRRIDPDLLDETLNIRRGGSVPGYGPVLDGGDIRMGVERNAYGRPVAYWFLTTAPGDDLGGVTAVRWRRVTADRIIHRFMNEELRADTARGVPWIYAAIRRMAMLGGAEEAVLVAFRTGASKMGFFVPPAPVGGGGAISESPNGDKLGNDVDAGGNLVTEAEPGTFDKLPPGWDLKEWNPAYPNESTDPFVKAMLRAFASSVGLTYNTVGNDLAGVSLSAMRHGANQDRDTYESIQQWVKDHLCVPMFEPWLALGLDLGRIGTLPADGFERFNKPKFIARPSRSPDPQKDIAAAAQAVALGVTSRTRVAAERGDDLEEIFDELAQEEAMAKTKGVSLNTQAAMASKNPPTDSQTPKVDGNGSNDSNDGADPADPTAEEDAQA